MTKRNFFKIGLTACLAVLASCSPQPKNIFTGNTIDGENIWEIMSDIGVTTDVFITRDRIYSYPSLSFIQGQFSEGLRSFFWSLSSGAWTPEGNDCDDFALGAAFYMGYLHHSTQYKVEVSGIAFGEFYYIRDSGEGHAINVALVKNKDGAIKVVFYEPQTYSIVELSKSEIQSCIFWRF
jgi:hypothetical protein